MSDTVKGLGEGLLTVFSSASAVQEARWLLGTASWHLSQSLSAAEWLFLAADASLWLKSISSEHLVCSRGLSRVICRMHSHPCLICPIWMENNSGYKICKESLWPQHFGNKMCDYCLCLCCSLCKLANEKWMQYIFFLWGNWNPLPCTTLAH